MLCKKRLCSPLCISWFPRTLEAKVSCLPVIVEDIKRAEETRLSLMGSYPILA
jgi:hypothetical protein